MPIVFQTCQQNYNMIEFTSTRQSSKHNFEFGLAAHAEHFHFQCLLCNARPCSFNQGVCQSLSQSRLGMGSSVQILHNWPQDKTIQEEYL